MSSSTSDLPIGKTLRLEKCVRHRAADQQFVDFSFDKRFDDRYLVRNLCCRQESRQTAVRGRGEPFRESSALFPSKARRHSRRQMRDAFGRCVCPMGGAERIVYINVAKRGELFAKSLRRSFLLRHETEDFQAAGPGRFEGC